MDQQAIESYEGTYLIWGPPGCGKTTFLARQVENIVSKTERRDDNSSPVLVCSLTKTAAHEIAARNLPIPSWQVGTLHAHAYRRMGRPPIAETLIDDWNERYAGTHLELRRESVRGDLDDMQTEAGISAGKDTRGMVFYQEYNLYRQRMIERDVWKPEVRQFAEKWEEWKRSLDAIDFTDMIEIALRDISSGPGRPKVIVTDEAQDHSKLELSLLKKWGKTAGALMLCGDPYQSIFVWRGADPYIFFDPDVPETHRRRLHQSYRVPIAVRDYAMRIASRLHDYQDFTYHARRDESHQEVAGQIFRCRATYSNPQDAVRRAMQFVERGETVMFCASCAYMLRSLIHDLRKRGAPFCNPRRPSRGDWNPLRPSHGVSTAQRLMSFLRIDHGFYTFDSDDPETRWRLWTGQEFARWAPKLKAKGVLRRGAKQEITRIGRALRDEVITVSQLSSIFTPEAMDDIARVIDPDQPMTSNQLVNWYANRLESAFVKRIQYPGEIVARGGTAGLATALKEDPPIFVGTIHSFKGYQADHVFVFPDLSPAGDSEYMEPMTRDNVIRTFYVAVTRARQSVTICGRSGNRAFDLETPAKFVGRLGAA